MRVLLLGGVLSLILAGTAASAEDSSSTLSRELQAQYFNACMNDWDRATHMTKEEWSRTCRRLADERVKFRLEHGGEFKPKQKQD